MANISQTGTFSVDDLLAVRYASAAEFGADKIFDALKNDLAFYNGMVTEQMGIMAEVLSEQSRVYGGSTLHKMVQVDEFGKAASQKAFVTSDVSFPLRLFSSSIGWTSKYAEIATPAEMASEYLAVRGGHSYEITRQIKKAIYANTNYTFVDKLTNGVSLGVKRFVNADSATIPDYNGVSFDGASHTHYAARISTLAASDITTLVSNVTEHGHTRGLMLVIALADKATVAALGSPYVALGNAVIAYNNTDTTKMMLDNSDLNNQMIGFWGDIPVWVKPYAVANYILCISGDGEKPLGFRQRAQSSLQGLRLVAEIPGYPLVSKSFEAEFGVGVNCRTAGAVLYIGNTTWADATIA